MEALSSLPLPKDLVFCVPDGATDGLLRDELGSSWIPANTTLLVPSVLFPVLFYGYAFD